jgi:branched-chain amino acid transport system permease protein
MPNFTPRWVQWTPVLAVGLLLALVPVLALALDQPFLVRVFSRVIVFGVAAVSLNLLLGHAGLISVMHAAILGLGGYIVAILASHGGDERMHPLLPVPGTFNLLVSAPVAVLACAAVSALLGAVALRTRGAYFIMITLAFNQMLYYLFVSLDRYGGDEGLQVRAPLRIGQTALDQPVASYYLALASLLLVMVLFARLVRSRFGVVIRAAAGNERRVHSVGIAAGRYQLAALAIAGAVAGLAGVLLVTTQQFVSPADMAWTRSGELIVMVVLGGTSAIWGPVAGAAVFLLLELGLSGLSIHWQLGFGLLIILMVVFLRSGLTGLVGKAIARRGK